MTLLAESAILVDGTVAVTGGTSTTLKSLGNTSSIHNLYLDDGASELLRTEVVASVKAPKVSVSAPNGYTQSRTSVFFKVPKLLANGKTTVNTFELKGAFDPETTDAERATVRNMAIQVLENYPSFWDDRATG